MACEPFNIPGMGTGIICSRGVRSKKCQFCGGRCTKECDYPSHKKSGTCDARMCDQHATPGGEEIDYCPDHAPFVFPVGDHRIIVASMRSIKEGIRIDRDHSPLGNPFRPADLNSEEDRRLCIANYRRWLWDQMKCAVSEPAQEIARLTELVTYQNLTLLCWCAPKSCHGQVVAKAVKWLIEGKAAAPAGV